MAFVRVGFSVLWLLTRNVTIGISELERRICRVCGIYTYGTGGRNANSYSFVLSPNADLSGALASQDQSTTAFNYAGPLDYSRAYYWQVIAWKDGTRLTTSAVGVFNTMAEPVEPPLPVLVEEQPAPVINIPPAEQITPIWIYAIIGVGAALAVVVIVLIVRTIRP